MAGKIRTPRQTKREKLRNLTGRLIKNNTQFQKEIKEEAKKNEDKE